MGSLVNPYGGLRGAVCVRGKAAMYVFRPQHLPGHAPGCVISGGRAHQIRAGRQAPKANARVRAHGRRQHLLARQRLQLRDIPGLPGVRPTPEGIDPHGPGDIDGDIEEELQRPALREEGQGVKARLRRRLVERRASELVAALGRRHGESWASCVLQGGFHIHEGMRTICEAFGLRPDLERQVLRSTVERAKKWSDQASQPAASALEGPGLAGLLSSGEEAPSSRGHLRVSRYDLCPESDGNCSSPRSLASPADSCPSSPFLTPIQDLGSPLLPHCKRSKSQELHDLGLEGENKAFAGILAQQSNAATDAPTWKAPWRVRALRALGFDAWLSHSASTGEAVNSAVSGRIQEPLEEGSEDEDAALAWRLVHAVQNAEQQAASSQAALGPHRLAGTSAGMLVQSDSEEEEDEEEEGDEESSQSEPESPSFSSSRGLQQSNKFCSNQRREAHFSSRSEICFFDLNEAAGTGYQRSLQTKAFDGPSGHKAKRFRPPTEASSRELLSSRTQDSSSEDEDEEEPHEWEEKCDEVAELMSRQRHMLLWSPAW